MYKYSFIKNTFIYTLFNVLVKAIPFLLLPVLTRYLSPSDYGIIALFQVILAFMIVFIRLNSDGAIMVNFFKLDKQKLRIYIGNVFLVILTNVILVFALLYILGASFSHFLKFPRLWLSIGVLIALGEVIISLVLVLWQAEQKALSFGLFNLANVVTNAGLSLFFVVLLGLNWQGRLLGISSTSFIFAFLGIFILWKRNYKKFLFDKEYIKDILFFGIPLIPYALGGWIITNIDRIFINSMVGLASTGIYTVGYQVGMIIGLLATSFNTAWTPFLFKKLQENNDSTKIKIVKYTYLYCISLIGLALFLGFVAPTLLSFLVGKSFYGASQYVKWIAMGFAFEGIYLIVGNYIFYVKKTYLLSLVTISCGLLNIVLNYFLIKLNGALGAAQATFLTYVIFCLGTWFLSSRVYKMPWRLGFLALLKGKYS